MTYILVADQDLVENNKICSYYNNKIGFKVVSALNGKTTLEEYNKINPDIFILSTNLEDINYNEIIRKISYNDNEKFNCNIVLIANSSNEIINISHISKLYSFFITPFDYYDLFDVIEEMSLYNLDMKIDRLFLKTNIPLRSNASDRVRKAVRKCYYSPELTRDLEYTFSIVASDLKTSSEAIRSSFRTSLKQLNLIKNNDNTLKFTIFNFFDRDKDVTPKNFLEISTYYLHNTKK